MTDVTIIPAQPNQLVASVHVNEHGKVTVKHHRVIAWELSPCDPSLPEPSYQNRAILASEGAAYDRVVTPFGRVRLHSLPSFCYYAAQQEPDGTILINVEGEFVSSQMLVDRYHWLAEGYMERQTND